MADQPNGVVGTDEEGVFNLKDVYEDCKRELEEGKVLANKNMMLMRLIEMYSQAQTENAQYKELYDALNDPDED